MHQDKFKVSYSHIPEEDWNRIFDRTWLTWHDPNVSCNVANCYVCEKRRELKENNARAKAATKRHGVKLRHGPVEWEQLWEYGRWVVRRKD